MSKHRPEISKAAIRLQKPVIRIGVDKTIIYCMNPSNPIKPILINTNKQDLCKIYRLLSIHTVFGGVIDAIFGVKP